MICVGLSIDQMSVNIAYSLTHASQTVIMYNNKW